MIYYRGARIDIAGSAYQKVVECVACMPIPTGPDRRLWAGDVEPWQNEVSRGLWDSLHDSLDLGGPGIHGMSENSPLIRSMRDDS